MERNCCSDQYYVILDGILFGLVKQINHLLASH
jgi:hypothetical protein